MLPLEGLVRREPWQQGPLRETNLRRQLNPELANFRELLGRCDRSDALAGGITVWLDNFTQALYIRAERQEEEEKLLRGVLVKYAKLLRENLRDPLGYVLLGLNTPVLLDAEAVLGNDGHTYGRHSLAVYLSLIPPEQRHCSPLAPRQQEPFATSPSPLVSHLIAWLQRHGERYDLSAEIERSYAALLAQQAAAPPPAAGPNVGQRRAARAAQRAEQRAARRAEREQNLHEMEAALEQQLQQAQLGLDQNIARLQAAREESRQQEARQNERIEAFRRDDEAERQVLRQAIADLQVQIDELEGRNIAVEANNEGLGRQIAAADAYNIRLQEGINAVSLANKKRERGWLKSFLREGLKIGLCALATYGCQGALTFVPVKGGAVSTFRLM